MDNIYTVGMGAVTENFQKHNQEKEGRFDKTNSSAIGSRIKLGYSNSNKKLEFANAVVDFKPTQTTI